MSTAVVTLVVNDGIADVTLVDKDNSVDVNLVVMDGIADVTLVSKDGICMYDLSPHGLLLHCTGRWLSNRNIYTFLLQTRQ